MRAVLVLAIGAAAVLAAPASAATATPRVAGHTVVRGHGRVGVRMWVPRRATIRSTNGPTSTPDGVRLAVKNATYAFVGIDNPASCGKDPFFRVCMIVQAAYFGTGAGHGETFLSTIDPPALSPGVADVYVVTDGTATLTIDFTNLGGATTVTATRPVNASMKAIPRRCTVQSVAPPCDTTLSSGAVHQGWGGIAGDVGPRGFVMAAGFAHGGPTTSVGQDQIPAQSISPITSCMYPWYSTPASADPAKHPYGCDVVGESGSDEATWHATRLAQTAYWPMGSGGGRVQTYYAAAGKVYVGFNGTNASPQPGGVIAAYGVWVRAGIP